jgi:TolB-like protein
LGEWTSRGDCISNDSSLRRLRLRQQPARADARRPAGQASAATGDGLGDARRARRTRRHPRGASAGRLARRHLCRLRAGPDFCIAQIRAALGDTAGTPRYVRTIAKQGYEFICPVDTVDNGRGRRWAVIWGVTAALSLVLAAIVVSIAIPHQPTPLVIAVARFDNETGDPTLTRLSDSLTDSVVAELTRDGPGRYAIIGNAALLRRDRADRDLGAIATALHAQYVVLGQLQRDDAGLRVLAHLIHLPEQTHVAVSRTDQIADVSLSAVDGLAATIAAAFDARLRASRQPAGSRPSPPPPSH